MARAGGQRYWTKEMGATGLSCSYGRCRRQGTDRKVFQSVSFHHGTAYLALGVSAEFRPFLIARRDAASDRSKPFVVIVMFIRDVEFPGVWASHWHFETNVDLTELDAVIKVAPVDLKIHNTQISHFNLYFCLGARGAIHIL